MDHVENVVAWIRNYFEENGKGCKAVIGISGGTDSSVVAALLVKALGKENVIGVLMPNGDQHDIDVSRSLVELLGIKHHEINIKGPVDALREEFKAKLALDPNDYDVYKTNTPARIRMATLYGISAIYGGRVANTCNLSEDYVGYSTKFGDAAGDFSPLSDFTKTEVRELGRELGLPARFVEKVPEDGMSGKSDEEKLGFTYEMLDKYIRTGVIEDEAIKAKIDRMHKLNLHKLQLMPSYKQGK
jgi:NAD+ synthase